MVIKTFIAGMMQTNCYVASNEETKECFLVDPAVCTPDMVSYIKENGLKLQAILLTHGHFDHILGITEFLREFEVPVYAYEAEKELLEDAEKNLSSAYGMFYTFKEAEYLKDGQVLEIAGMKIKVIYTPGHTVGGCCYYLEEEKVLFSGDTLFYTSIGRTDFETGSYNKLVNSVRLKLFRLPDEVKVYPGHMSETTIGYEKKYNPFL